MTTREALYRIRNDPEFIYIKRLDYSLAAACERFPDGAPNKTIAQALMLTVEDVEKRYNNIISRLRERIVDPVL